MCPCGRKATITSKKHNGEINGYYCEFCNIPSFKPPVVDNDVINLNKRRGWK